MDVVLVDARLWMLRATETQRNRHPKEAPARRKEQPAMTFYLQLWFWGSCLLHEIDSFRMMVSGKWFAQVSRKVLSCRNLPENCCRRYRNQGVLSSSYVYQIGDALTP